MTPRAVTSDDASPMAKLRRVEARLDEHDFRAATTAKSTAPAQGRRLAADSTPGASVAHAGGAWACHAAALPQRRPPAPPARDRVP